MRVPNVCSTTHRFGSGVNPLVPGARWTTGIQVSDDKIAALPITRHHFHGGWNYTLHPQQPEEVTPKNSTPDRPSANTSPRLAPRSLQDPELTGMTRQQLSALIDTLVPALEAQREQVLRTRRGHERLVAPGTGAKCHHINTSTARFRTPSDVARFLAFKPT
ncbi:hypothetical protein ACFXKC_43435 [Streptomyces sp. NPDC059340]|uniref:ISAzo13-like element transposase-related protein n=1 Tax=Streptomyces sp. NPDC059340 TaxID=3346806 RepID=UPI00368F127D